MQPQDKRIPLRGWLATHYQLDDMPAWMFRNNYQSAVNILSNPAKFPRANMAVVERLADELFACDPVACTLGQ